MELLIYHEGELYVVPRVHDLPIEELDLMASSDIEGLTHEVDHLISSLEDGQGPAPEPFRAITLLGDIEVRNECG